MAKKADSGSGGADGASNSGSTNDDGGNTDTGSSGSNTDGGNTDGSTGGNTGGTDTGKTYTQAEVDALDQKLNKRYTSAAEKALLEKFGVENSGALQALVDADKKAKEDQLTESQLATKAAQEAQATATKATADALVAITEAKLSTALITPGDDKEKEPGLNPARMAAAMAIALPHALASDDQETAIAEAVAHARATVPEIFGAADGAKKPPTSPGTPGLKNGQRSDTKSGDPKDGAAAVLEWSKNRKGLAPLPGQPDTN